MKDLVSCDYEGADVADFFFPQFTQIRLGPVLQMKRLQIILSFVFGVCAGSKIFSNLADLVFWNRTVYLLTFW